jgi:hypothetical protein
MSEQPNKPTDAQPQQVRRVRKTRTARSLFFPIILIALGVIFLLRNMGLLPGDTWDLLLRLWPLILIAMGLDNLLTRQGVAAPMIFIAIGAVILLSNLDIVQWNIWQVILNLWPVLFVAIGLDLLVARRSAWGAVLALILMIAILGGALFIMAVNSPTGAAIGSQPVGQTLNGAERAVVQIEPAVASLNIHAFDESAPAGDQLMQGTVQLTSIGTLQEDYSLTGETGTLSLRREGEFNFLPSLRGSDWVWDLAFNPDTPLELQVDLGAGSIDMDLSGLQVTDVDIQLGLGKTEVILPDLAGVLTVNIEGAIGETIIYIPADTAVTLTASTALSAISVPDGFVQDGDVYTLAGSGSNPDDRIELSVGQAIGRISIRVR